MDCKPFFARQLLGRAVFLSLLLVRTLQPAAAAPAKASAAVPGFTFIKSLGGIDEYRLDSNGMQVLIKPDHSAPVVTFNVLYRVGSRNEVTGTTGATHLLEHLMFKGSEAFNDMRGNSVKQFLENVGGQYNATTSQDRTNYFATVGRDSLAGYMAIESDRMRNLWLHNQDKQAEMTVVRNEYERGENDPSSALMKEVLAAAYQALPYHHPIIGWRSDIENVSVEKLRAFYDTFYWPNNATAILVGDVDAASALAMVKKYYGGYPKSPRDIPVIYTQEPEQTGPRRVMVKRPGQLGTVVIAHKIPNALDEDMAPIAVLDSILSEGKNSRLYRALVDTGSCTNAVATGGGSRDVSLHMVFADMAPGAKQEEVEKIALTELERVKKDGVTVQEVTSAIRRYHSGTAFTRDGTSAIVGGLNETTASGDWTLYVTMEELVAQVKPVDVQRVARKYLNEDQSTTGWFVPVIAEQNAASGQPAATP